MEIHQRPFCENNWHSSCHHSIETLLTQPLKKVYSYVFVLVFSQLAKIDWVKIRQTWQNIRIIDRVNSVPNLLFPRALSIPFSVSSQKKKFSLRWPKIKWKLPWQKQFNYEKRFVTIAQDEGIKERITWHKGIDPEVSKQERCDASLISYGLFHLHLRGSTFATL